MVIILSFVVTLVFSVCVMQFDRVSCALPPRLPPLPPMMLMMLLLPFPLPLFFLLLLLLLFLLLPSRRLFLYFFCFAHFLFSGGLLTFGLALPLFLSNSLIMALSFSVSLHNVHTLQTPSLPLSLNTHKHTPTSSNIPLFSSSPPSLLHPVRPPSLPIFPPPPLSSAEAETSPVLQQSAHSPLPPTPPHSPTLPPSPIPPLPPPLRASSTPSI